ncbi:MAG: toll/interleukin-1 receptor domain-containing protein [Anaerolineae bacterium]|nr:toll/interleukin-1 receptor domain-containing protein [Anaerolineae bacterium]
MSGQRLLLTFIAVLLFIVSVVWFVLELTSQKPAAGTLPLGPIIALAVAAVLALLTRLPAVLGDTRPGWGTRRPGRRPYTQMRQADRPGGGSQVFSDDVEVESPAELPPWLKEVTSPEDRPGGPADNVPPMMEPEPAAGEPAGKEPGSFDWLEEMAREVEETAASADEEPEAAAAEPAAEEPAVHRRNGGEDEAAPGAPIRFSAYYPREVRPQNWQPLRAYLFKDFAIEAVRADAQAQFGPRTDIRETVREALAPIPEEALVTTIPDLPGFEFDPPQASARFRRDWRRFDFEFRAVDAPLDTSADGRITFLVEGVVVADVPLSVFVSQTAGQAVFQPAEATASPYQAIFCSYSHRDTRIVERVERASRYFNFRYLRDVTTLRSGEEWNPRLLELIGEADIFQLFWSAHAAASEYVRQEYLHALELCNSGRKGRYFIRPVRWEEPMPVPPPAELAGLHFDLIPELVEES